MKKSLFVLFSLLSLLGFSQNYPVQTTIQLTPPYTSYLPDYTDGVNSKLQVALNITDVNEPVLQVKLKVTLEGPGGKIVTNPNFVQSPITLNFGEALVLSGDELAPYLAFQNLVFPSETFKQNYQQTKVLPEGLWKLCVDVVDATNPSSELLSSNNCALMFVARLQPPMLNLPVCEATLPRSQTIFFSWTDMALGSYAIGHEPLYDFSLYSVPISAYENPTQVLNTNPIYTETTTIPSLNLDTNLILLPAGQKYLWQVKARFADGSGAYLNNGNSAPCVFTFGDLAQEIIDDLTINLTAQGTGPTVGQASWTLTSASGGSSQFDSYEILFKKTGSDEDSWYLDSTSNLSFVIYQLEDSTSYDIKVRGLIGDKISEWTDVVTFMTQPYPNYACGDGNIRPLPPTYQPLLPLNAYEGIKVNQGQFVMDVTSINPSGTGEGRYAGTGRIHIDFLFVNVRVSFSDLLIDDQYNAREGEIIVITKGIKEWLHDQYADLVDPTFINGIIDSVNVTDSIASVYVNGVLLDTFSFNPPDYPIIFQDDDGTEYTVLANGTITTGTFLDVEDEYLGVNKDKVVKFAQNDGETFGFDGKQYIQWHENYEVIHCKDTSNYFVANKSLGVNVGDLVDVIFDPAKTGTVKLRQGLDGSPISGQNVTDFDTKKKITFTLPAISESGSVAFYAYDDHDSLVGKLNVEVYEEVTRKVYIVPVASAEVNESQLEDYLNKTIGEANVKLDVELRPAFSNENFNAQTQFGLPDATLLSKYTPQMRSLRDQYFGENEEIDEDALLMFIVANLYDSLATESIGGYMVRGKSLGFINVSHVNNYLTYAHEIGHGTGGLEHSWKHNGPTQGMTDNLMDYNINQGNNLLKSQWDLIQNPGFVNTLWDEEEDASKIDFDTKNKNVMYFWKENSNGIIEDGIIYTHFEVSSGGSTKLKPYFTDQAIVTSNYSGKCETIWGSIEDFKTAKAKKGKCLDCKCIDDGVTILTPRTTQKTESTLIVKKGESNVNVLVANSGDGKSETYKGKVVYFDKYGANLKFNHTEDKMNLAKYGYLSDVSNHYYVITERAYDADGEQYISKQIVIRFSDKVDVTSQFSGPEAERYNSTAGKNVFYVWEEDENGFIKNNNIKGGYNFMTERTVAKNYAENRYGISHYETIYAVKKGLEEANNKPKNLDDPFYSSINYHNQIDILKERDEKFSESTIIFKGNNPYIIDVKEDADQIVYINVINNKYKFDHTSRILKLDFLNYESEVWNHYYVLTYWNANGQITNQEVFDYYGGDVTHQFDDNKDVNIGLRNTVFVNGYRPLVNSGGFQDYYRAFRNNNNNLEKPITSNPIYTMDNFDYWHSFDDLMIDKLKTNNVFYADGHRSASTSNHGSPGRAGLITDIVYPKRCVDTNNILIPKNGTHHCEQTKALLIDNTFPIPDTPENRAYLDAGDVIFVGGVPEYTPIVYDTKNEFLKLTSNVDGFLERFVGGQYAAEKMKNELENRLTTADKAAGKIAGTDKHDISRDTLDIVCHSMGFAYALGMIEYFKTQTSIKFGRFYIIAPENPEAVGLSGLIETSWMIQPGGFTEVWHYGSNLYMSNEDPPCMQDGVAPQKDIAGLGEKRIPFPSSEDRLKGVKDSHYIGFYNWIFNQQSKGKIKQRN